MARRGTGNDDPAAPRRVEREETGKLKTAAFASMTDAGNMEPADEPEDSIEKFAAHMIRKGRKGNWLAVVVVSALFGTGGFFGMRAAGERRDEKIHEVQHDASTHDAKPAHDGAATRVEVKELEDKVQKLDKSVGVLGSKIDSQEKAQNQRHGDIVEELKWIRRNR